MPDPTIPAGVSGGPVAVAGRLDRSIVDFERSCLVHIGEEQARPNPDNALIAVLCDAVRLAREYSERPPAGVSGGVAGPATNRPLDTYHWGETMPQYAVLGIGVEAWVELEQIERTGQRHRNNDLSGMSISWRTFRLVMTVLRAVRLADFRERPPAAVPDGAALPYLFESLITARDVLAAFGVEAGRLPEQGGYSATMTEAETKLTRAVANLDEIIQNNAPLLSQPAADRAALQANLEWALRFVESHLRGQHSNAFDKFEDCDAPECVRFREVAATLRRGGEEGTR